MKKIITLAFLILFLGCDKEVPTIKINAEFTFTAIISNTDTIVGTPVNIDFSLSQITEGDISYTMIFETTGEGTLNYRGNIYNAGEAILIEPGASNGSYTGSIGGEHQIKFSVTVINAPSIDQEDTVSVNIQDYLFEFDGYSDVDVTYTGAVTALIFNLSEIEGSSSSYQMRYVINSGDAIIRDDIGSELNANVYHLIEDAPGNFTWTIEGVTAETIDISFYMKNHIDNEISINISINVVPASDFNIVNNYTSMETLAVGGACGGEVCRIDYYTRVTFLVTSAATTDSLRFMYLQRTSDNTYIDNVERDILLGGQISFIESTEPLLLPNEEYEISFFNMETGEEITKTFISANTPPDESIQPCFCGG